MSSYNRRYKVMNAMNNKQLINDEIVLRYMPKDVEEPSRPPRVTVAMVLNKLTEFIGEQRNHNASVGSRLDRIELTLKEHGNRLDRIDAKFIKQDEFNQEQRKLNERFIEYMDKHP